MSVNIKESKRFFNQILEDAKNISIQCSTVVNQFHTIPWGPFQNFSTVDEANGIIGRYAPLLNEFKDNFQVVKNNFDNLIESYKRKEIDAFDFNMQVIDITQNIMGYIDLIGASGLADVNKAYMYKQASYQQPAVATQNTH